MLTLLLICSFMFAGPQQPPIKEARQIKVLKVERLKHSEDTTVWYAVRLTVKDKDNRLIRMAAECVSTNPESGASCAHLSVPHAGQILTVTFIGGAIVQFGEDKLLYEVESEEVSG